MSLYVYCNFISNYGISCGYFSLEIGQNQQSPLKNQKSQQRRGLSLNYDVSVGRNEGQKQPILLSKKAQKRGEGRRWSKIASFLNMRPTLAQMSSQGPRWFFSRPIFYSANYELSERSCLKFVVKCKSEIGHSTTCELMTMESTQKMLLFWALWL